MGWLSSAGLARVTAALATVLGFATAALAAAGNEAPALAVTLDVPGNGLADLPATTAWACRTAGGPVSASRRCVSALPNWAES